MATPHYYKGKSTSGGGGGGGGAKAPPPEINPVLISYQTAFLSPCLNSPEMNLVVNL